MAEQQDEQSGYSVDGVDGVVVQQMLYGCPPLIVADLFRSGSTWENRDFNILG
ncbi:hypothetical protein MPHL43072_19775 [Mycolicibacterium phlei DSM 43072]|uniref:Uncharacterized protein n=1 Tax=Mycolicibacterium phlei DSM 43239 = CCUG 21000 TaxID=1226750 RepID=A0A5N5V6D0_MYCPH|nr:hypothetical protein MPHL21000_07540 [Mycolicibacterium phlei DSM 43239 = CCUG 21000]KXW66327.1 hypothetical protein MPHL43239_08125 [Mycolicibacterium phlei DSM 43239 = CCUG 21000]KXW67691.1 hypothetical protein MPHL43070_20020 [Mycolicibacterium phlei DSM 43070]KXW70384.1 hypothetical protein MPHL43072_19775 [Mycolicibacterium phlei DSM 43072]